MIDVGTQMAKQGKKKQHTKLFAKYRFCENLTILRIIYL